MELGGRLLISSLILVSHQLVTSLWYKYKICLHTFLSNSPTLERHLWKAFKIVQSLLNRQLPHTTSKFNRRAYHAKKLCNGDSFPWQPPMPSLTTALKGRLCHMTLLILPHHQLVHSAFSIYMSHFQGVVEGWVLGCCMILTTNSSGHLMIQHWLMKTKDWKSYVNFETKIRAAQ